MHFTDEGQALKIDISLKLFNTVNICRKKILTTPGFMYKSKAVLVLPRNEVRNVSLSQVW